MATMKYTIKDRHIWRAVISLIIVVLIFWGAFSLAHLAQENNAVEQLAIQYGYWALLLLSIISGFNIIIPIPAVSLLPLFVNVGLHIWPAILVITLGMTFADTIACIIGNAGRELASKKWLSSAIQKALETNSVAPSILVFLYAALVPFPNEVLIIPLTFFGYHVRSLILPLFFGNALFTILATFGILRIFGFLS